jgi:hypothetical protein
MVATVEDSVLRMEMTGLESQEEDDPKRVLFFKPMSFLGQITDFTVENQITRDESWSVVSGRRFSPRQWALRSQSLRRSHLRRSLLRLVVEGNFR